MSREDFKMSMVSLFKWIVTALVSGIIGAVLLNNFNNGIVYVNKLLFSYSSFLPLWAMLGAVITGSLIYYFIPYASGEGLPSYIKGMRKNDGQFSFSVTAGKLMAAFVTLSTFGNGGIVGPIARVNAGITSKIFQSNKKNFVFSGNTATAAICGVSAIVGAVFHSSIGGGIFAVEIMQREKINYSKLFPAILASSTAVFVAKSMGWEAVYYFPRVENTMHMSNTHLLFLLSIITGFMGVAYTKFYIFVTTVFGRDVMKKMSLKTIAGTAVAAFSVFFIAPELMGTSSTVFSGVLGKNYELFNSWSEFPLPIFAVVIFFALLKAFANCVTVGSGMSAGFTGPATITGILTGAAFAFFFGIPPVGPDYYAFVAAGFSGILASSMNIPLAAAVIAIETFGLEVSFPAGIAAVIGFQINRQHTIYRFAFKEK